MGEDEISPKLEEEEQTLSERFATRFQKEFPEYPGIFRTRGRLFIYGDAGREKTYPVMLLGSDGYRVQIGLGRAKVVNLVDGTRTLELVHGPSANLRRPGFYDLKGDLGSIENNVASWGKDELEEAVYFARLYKEGLVVDKKFLGEYSTWTNPEFNPGVEERPMTFAEQIRWQRRQGIYKAEGIVVEGSGTPLLARRIERLSREEVVKLTSARIGAQEEPTVFIPGVGQVPKEQALIELQNNTDLAEKIIRAQIIAIEARITQLQVGNFTVANETPKEDEEKVDEVLPPLEVPEDIRNLLEQEVAEAIDPIREDDPEFVELFAQKYLDAAVATYALLDWVNKTTNPQRVLYPASGRDKIPKLAFGDDKVVHTSLEGKRGEDHAYFPTLGEGYKVIADNSALPFKNEVFDVICLLESDRLILGHETSDYTRIVKTGGLLVLSTDHMFTDEDDRVADYRSNPRFEELSVPREFQMRGESQSEFTVFRKKE